MSDKAKFHRMTRPMKFRKFKMMTQGAASTYEVGRERINYLINNMLYKLNILDRYTFNDLITRDIKVSFKLPVKQVSSPYIRGTVAMKLVEETSIDTDYFYKKNKYGEKEIKYCMKNKDEKRLFVVGRLENIEINVAGWRSVDNFPKFKTQVFDTKNKHNKSEDIVGYSTVTYDIDKVRKLEAKRLLGYFIESEEIAKPVMQYYYELLCLDLEQQLNQLNLENLMMEVS